MANSTGGQDRDDASSSGEKNPTSCVIPGHADINDFSQKALRSVLKATRSSNDLPVGDDFDFYSTYRSVRDVLDIEGQRVLSLLRQLLRSQHVKGTISHGDAVEIDDKFDVLMDANDQLLERAGTLLDEASGVRKEETKLVIASLSVKQPKPTTSWNKKATASTGKSPVSYSLVTAKNIQRPQLQFRDKIDNSNLPFKPQLRVKPHPLKSLEESLKLPEGVQPEDVERPDFNYPHPYQVEINNFTPSQECLQQAVPQEPKPLNLTPLLVVTTEKQLHDMMDDLRRQTEIAVDLEHHSYRSFQGITCLLQISTRSHDYIVDTLELRSHLGVLNEVFTDPNIVKVLHGADSDIGWLQRDFSVYVVNMFDTGQAARLLGLSRFSLAHLLMSYCQVEADKQFQLADWRIRPLPQELINYAREDTHFLLYIYDVMRNQLLDRGNSTGNLLTSVYDRSKAVALKVYQKPNFTEEDYLELYKKSKKVFNNQQLAALKDLYSWRDSMARLEDESLGYVLPNHMLLQIAEILPRERQGVLACCNPIPPLVRQNLMEMHAMVLQAREVVLIKVEKRPVVQPSNLQHPKYNMDSLFNCPHDMSHLDDPIIKLEILEPGLISEGGAMYGGGGAEVTLKTTPSVQAYEWRNNQIQFTAREKAERVKAFFFDPFAKFMPKAIRGDGISMESVDMWRMKASNVHPSASNKQEPKKEKKNAEDLDLDLDTFEPEYVPPSKRPKVSASSLSSSTSVFRVPSVPSAAATTSAGSAKSLFSIPASVVSSEINERVERKIKSLREEVNMKKKKKKKALKEKEKRNKAKEGESTETPLTCESLQSGNEIDRNQSAFPSAVSSSSSSSSSSSLSSPSMSSVSSISTSTVTSRTAVEAQPGVTKKQKKKAKKSKLSTEEVEENFTAFDYPAAEQALEKKKKEKKKQDLYNPALPSRMGKDKNKAKRPKLSSAKSNKLISFGPSMPSQGGRKNKK